MRACRARVALAAVLALVAVFLSPVPAHATVTAMTGQAHVAYRGWLPPTSGVIGTVGESRQLEALRLPGPVRVEAHVAYLGWLPSVDMQAPGAYAGTVGESRRMEAVRITWDPTWADTGAVLEYRCHVAYLGWLPWVREGQVCGTTGQARQMEAIEVRVTSAPTSTPAPTPTTPPPPPTGTSFAVTADTGMEAAGAAVLSSIGASGVSWVAHLGDLAYQPGVEQAWCGWVKARVSQPVSLLPGTHEGVAVNDGAYAAYVGCLPDRLGVQGSYATGSYYLDRGSVRYIGISPGVDLPSGTRTYAKGTAEREVVKDWIDTAKAAGMWVVVGMHHGCLTLGVHGCASDPSLTDMLIGKHVDLILAGHDHNYARSHQITGTVSGPVVVDRDSDFAADAGSVVVTVGNGGHNPRPLARPVSGIWAAGWSGDWTGWVRIDATATRLTVRHVPVSGSGVDAFTVSR